MMLGGREASLPRRDGSATFDVNVSERGSTFSPQCTWMEPDDLPFRCAFLFLLCLCLCRHPCLSAHDTPTTLNPTDLPTARCT